jgi:uncharacterized protein YegP (UPF0339 family)
MVKSMRNVLALLFLAAFVMPLSLDSVAAQQKDKDKDTKAAYFEVYKDKGGKFRFRFFDNAGEEVAMAVHSYETKAECQKVVDEIKKEAAKAKVTDEEKK